MLATTQQYERRMILVQLAVSKKRQRRRKLRAMTATKSQRSETCVTGDKKLYERTIHTSLLPFFSDKILLIRKNLSLFVQGTMSTIIT